MQILILAYAVVAWIGTAYLTYQLAYSKYLKYQGSWFLAGLLLGPIALVAVAGMPLQSQIDDLDKQYPDARKYPV